MTISKYIVSRLVLLLWALLLSGGYAWPSLGFPFYSPELKWRPVTGVRLDRVDQRPDLGIRYRAFEASHDDAGVDSLKIEFGKLAREQFDYLMRSYGNGSKVPYDAEREYGLIDFLPPMMQALMDRRFEVENVDHREIAANCWGTAYEYARNGDNLVVFFANRHEVHSRLRDARFSILVGEAGRNDHERAVSRAKFGDVILFSENSKNGPFPERLMHATVFIDKNLHFEMVGFASEFPYRLVYNRGSGIHPAYRRIRNVEVRRFGEMGKERLPHPAMEFTENEMPIPVREFRLSFEQGGATAGRAYLPDEAYRDLIGVSTSGNSVTAVVGRYLGSCLSVLKRLLIPP